MKSGLVGISLLLISSLLLVSCGQADTELVVIQEQRTERYVVRLLSETAELEQSSNRLVLEFRSASTSELTEVDNVQIQATMPMPGMAPMFGEVSPSGVGGPGQYEFDAAFTMVGSWTLIVTFGSDERVQFNVNAY